MAKWKIFNDSEFKYAIKLLENNPYLSKERMESYLEKYPKDYYAKAYYTILLTRICKFEEAEKEYDKVATATKFNSLFEGNDAFSFYMVMAKLKILSATEKYREMYELYMKQYNVLEKTNLKYLLYYCRLKLGEAEPKKDSYLFNQCCNHSDEAFLNHVKKHTADYNQEADIENPVVFVPDFPLEKVFEEIKKYIPSDYKLFEGYFDNSYYFKYDNCGRVNNSLTDFFKVVCFHNTLNFITMYPTNNGENIPHIDLNYLKEKDIAKVKTLSQVEKFNKRYHLNRG